jgi:glycerol-3-phosphate dehydrogenase
VAYAATYEGAASIADFALRRTHAAWFSRNHARVDAKLIADELSTSLGWSDNETALQLDRFEAELSAEGL